MNSSKESTDFLIIGGGMVGLCLAKRLCDKSPNSKITIVDKEEEIGKHSSGRNSGVLHAGIYYKPQTLKAKVCITGAKRLIKWCKDENLEVLRCGKVITPQKKSLDEQIDFLYKRGQKNGAEVKIIDKREFNDRVPDGYTSTGRALWSPNTSVVNPKEILLRLKNRLIEKGVTFFLGSEVNKVDKFKNEITLSNELCINYKFLFNSAGLQADRIAHKFGVGLNYKIMPFKGIYWSLSPSSPLKFNTNLYPVPDLNLPFLGVHVTPSTTGVINLGPTAIPAFGRENYKNLENFEPIMYFKFLNELASQWFLNKGGFRKYSSEQLLHGFKPFFYSAAKLLIPNLDNNDLVPSKKVGIRAQLYDYQKKELIQDFKIEYLENSVHILNAISPAFTASFSFADLVLEKTNFLKKI